MRRLLYKTNENYFKCHSHNMFYIVGFLMADGCIHYSDGGRSRLSICLAKKDIEILEFIKSELGSERKIQITQRYSPQYNKTYEYCTLQINSPTICKDLEYFGITNQKTGKEQFKNIPKEYIIDFIRGYFDGDGCISNSSQWSFGIVCANKKFLEEIQSILNVGKICTHSTIYNLSITGIKNIGKVVKILYRNENSYGLSRKKKLLLEVLSLYNSGKYKQWRTIPQNIRDDVRYCYKSGMDNNSIISLYNISLTSFKRIIQEI